MSLENPLKNQAFDDTDTGRPIEREAPVDEPRPFVSGAYRLEEDVSLQPKQSIKETVDKAIKAKSDRQKYGDLRAPTEAEKKLMLRKLGEKED